MATRNAALSVRNLKRSLRVMESLGVNSDLVASSTIMDQVSRVRVRIFGNSWHINLLLPIVARSVVERCVVHSDICWKQLNRYLNSRWQ